MTDRPTGPATAYWTAEEAIKYAYNEGRQDAVDDFNARLDDLLAGERSAERARILAALPEALPPLMVNWPDRDDLRMWDQRLEGWRPDWVAIAAALAAAIERVLGEER